MNWGLEYGFQPFRALCTLDVGIDVVRRREPDIIVKQYFRREIQNAPEKILLLMPATGARSEERGIDLADGKVGIIQPGPILVSVARIRLEDVLQLLICVKALARLERP